MPEIPLPRLVGVMCGVLLAVGSCSSGDPLTPAGPSTGAAPVSPFHQVEIPGTVRDIAWGWDLEGGQRLLVAGVDDYGSLLMEVLDGEARYWGVDVSLPNDLGNGLASVESDGENTMVTELVDPDSTEAATWWLGFPYGEFASATPTDEDGRSPVWFEATFDGEMGLRGVGLVRAGDELQVRGWIGVNRWRALDNGPQLAVPTFDPFSPVQIGSTETSLVVAGDLTARGSEVVGPQIWELYDRRSGGRGTWQLQEPESAPDGLTDVADWEIGYWVAGYRDDRPVVYDFDWELDKTPGRELPVPDTELDPEHPVTLIARAPVTSPMVLATQSQAGPTLWVDGRSGWREIPGPPGRLTDAEVVGRQAYLLVSGNVWRVDLGKPMRG